MRINTINSVTKFKANNVKRNNQTVLNPIYTNSHYKKEPNTGLIILGALTGIAAAFGIYVAIMVAKKPPKMSFEELLSKKGLEFRNEILVNKNTGEKFTGELKRSTDEYGKGSGFKNIETRKFEDGIITENTNKDLWGKERSGKFYKEGKIYSDVTVFYGREGKIYCFSNYSQKGQEYAIGHGKCQKRSDSLFKAFREDAKKMTGRKTGIFFQKNKQKELIYENIIKF